MAHLELNCRGEKRRGQPMHAQETERILTREEKRGSVDSGQPPQTLAHSHAMPARREDRPSEQLDRGCGRAGAVLRC